MDRKYIIIKQEVGKNLKAAIKANIKSISELLSNPDIDNDDICVVGSYYLAKESSLPAEETKYWVVVTDYTAEDCELRFESNCGEYVFGLEEAIMA